MKLTEVVAQHGYPIKLAEINNAKLYSRENIEGVTDASLRSEDWQCNARRSDADCRAFARDPATYW
ncbi:MAG: hypothetical protein AB8A71_06415 [Prochlorococcus sp.]